MRVAVTGSAGFIGNAVVRRLRDEGIGYVELDQSVGLDILMDDIAVAIRGCSSVIHLAGVLGTQELFHSPEPAVDINIKGSLRVLQACAKEKVNYVGITMPSIWVNVYQATKNCARQLATAWHRNFGVGVSHVRAFNVFGPGQKVDGVQKIVPTFATRAWSGMPIPIWGDGSQVVDLIYVDDVARLLAEAIKYTDDRVIDGGTGQEISVQAVAELVLEITGGSSQIQYLPMRLGEEATTKPVASGEGWGGLTWKPEFRHDDFVSTVEWYRRFASRS